MRNLKKVLALTVALVMCFGLMTYGLAAEDYTKYTDAADIKYKDAVSLLTAMSIMQGMGEDKFAPKELLTRAMMAKMLYVMNNNSIDDQAKLYVNAACTLTDASTPDWATGYIKYCFNKTIIAGMGDNTFAGETNVTGLQAMKMLLVALGYDPIKEGFVGHGWGTNVGICAQNADLLDGIEDVDMTVEISREVAAQLIYNALFATRVHYVNGVLEKMLGDDNHTPLTFARDKLSLYILDGILVANDVVAVRALPANASLNIYPLAEQTICESGKSRIFTQVGRTDGAIVDTFVDLKVASSIDMIGKNVHAYVKIKAGESETKFGQKDVVDKVFGSVVEVAGRNVVTYGTSDDYETKYLTNNTDYYINYYYGEGQDVVDPTARTLKEEFDAYYGTDRDDIRESVGQKVVMISNNGDNSVEYVFGMDRRFGEVTTYSSDRLSLTKNDSSNYKSSFFSIEFEDIYNEADCALGDKVLMWRVFPAGDYVIDKVKSVVGTMTGSTGTSSKPKAIISGTNYTIAKDHINPEDVIMTDFVGKELTYYLDGDLICGVNDKGVTRSSDNYCVIRGSKATGTFGVSSEPKAFYAYILTSEAKKATYEIEAIYLNGQTNRGSSTKALMSDNIGNSLNVTNNPTPSVALIEDVGVFYVPSTFVGTDGAYVASFNTAAAPIDNRVFKYSLSANGKITLYEPDVFKANFVNKDKGAASLNYNYNASVEPGPDTRTAMPAARKSLDSLSVGFYQSARANADGDSWYVFTGYKNLPAMNIAEGVRLGQNNIFSAVTGKLTVKNDLIKAYAVVGSGYGETSKTTNNYGVILESTGTPVTGSKTEWYFTSLTLYDGQQVVTYSCKNGLKVNTSDFKGYNANAGRGTVVKFSLAGGIIDELNAVDLIANNRVDEDFVAGYVYSGYKNGAFAMASYYDLSNVYGIDTYRLSTDYTKAIYLKDGDNWTKLEDSYTLNANFDATDTVKPSAFDADQNLLYSAVVKLNDDGDVEAVFLFEKCVADTLDDDQRTNMWANVVDMHMSAPAETNVGAIHTEGGDVNDITVDAIGDYRYSITVPNNYVDGRTNPATTLPITWTLAQTGFAADAVAANTWGVIAHQAGATTTIVVEVPRGDGLVPFTGNFTLTAASTYNGNVSVEMVKVPVQRGTPNQVLNFNIMDDALTNWAYTLAPASIDIVDKNVDAKTTSVLPTTAGISYAIDAVRFDAGLSGNGAQPFVDATAISIGTGADLNKFILHSANRAIDQILLVAGLEIEIDVELTASTPGDDAAERFTEIKTITVPITVLNAIL